MSGVRRIGPVRWIVAALLGSLTLVVTIAWVVSLDGEVRWAHISPDGFVLGISPPRRAHTNILLYRGSLCVTHGSAVSPAAEVPYRSFSFCGLLLESRPSAPPVGTFDPNWEANYLKYRKLERYVSLPLWMAMLPLSLYPVAILSAAFMRGRRRAGFCTQCGYDLRGTPDRCPECGTASETDARLS